MTAPQASGIPWCCETFKSLISPPEAHDDDLFGRETGQRGFFGACRDDDGRPTFFLLHRAVAPGRESQFPSTPFPVSLISQIAIRFCPWCGVELGKQYKKEWAAFPALAPVGNR